jgi:hypothetical protein
LVGLFNTHAVMFFEILGNTDFLVLESESHSGGAVAEVHVGDGVRSAVTPVSNDDLLSVFCSHGCLPLFDIMIILLQLINSVQARTRAHKFKD